jgi:hypothetical protein
MQREGDRTTIMWLESPKVLSKRGVHIINNNNLLLIFPLKFKAIKLLYPKFYGD